MLSQLELEQLALAAIERANKLSHAALIARRDGDLSRAEALDEEQQEYVLLHHKLDKILEAA